MILLRRGTGQSGAPRRPWGRMVQVRGSEREGSGRGSEIALAADCGNCFALCCVGLAFTSSSDFAFDKAAGEPCSNLLADFRCSIHQALPAKGFRGCAVYDCFGSGQQVSQITYGGTDWRQDPGTAQQMFRVFPIMRNLHELLWHLD